MDCNIVEVKILKFKSCESLLFSNLFQRDYLFVLLENKQNGKSEEMIDHGFYPLSAIFYKFFNIYLILYKVYLEYLQVHVRSGEIW